MGLHRYVTPSYTGGLPAGYDLINVTSGGSGAGGSSFANPVKAGGANAGTYFLAQGEALDRANINRGFRALAENTDVLDDLLRRDIAVGAKTAVTTSAGELFYDLPVGTYLGPAGSGNQDLPTLFQVRQRSGETISTAAPGPEEINIASLTLTGPDTLGSGLFSQNTVRVNFSYAIPGGISYRVWYQKRSNLAVFDPQDLVTGPLMQPRVPHATGIGIGSVTSVPAGVTVQEALNGLDAVKAGFAIANTWTEPQTFNGAAGDLSAAFLTTTAPTNRKLLWEMATASASKNRIYAGSGQLEFTFNAMWTGTVWQADNIALDSGFVAMNSASTFHYTRPAGVGTWAAWPSPSLRVTTTVPSSSTAQSNTLHLNNIVKAWAVISTDGSGGSAVLAGFNVSSVSISGGNVLVNIGADMVGEYGVWTQNLGTGPASAYDITTRSAGQFTCVRKTLTGGGATLSMATNATVFCVQVLGQQ